jgi:hypothetical protein
LSIEGFFILRTSRLSSSKSPNSQLRTNFAPRAKIL